MGVADGLHITPVMRINAFTLAVAALALAPVVAVLGSFFVIPLVLIAAATLPVLAVVGLVVLIAKAAPIDESVAPRSRLTPAASMGH